jgi:hypothetical protein
VHRLRISQGRQNVVHSAETRAKISAAVRATKRRLQRERLAARAAQAAEAATADLRPVFTAADEAGGRDGGEGLLLDPMELEGAVIELTALRRQLTAWMDAYENSELLPTIVFTHSSINIAKSIHWTLHLAPQNTAASLISRRPPSRIPWCTADLRGTWRCGSWYDGRRWRRAAPP